MHLEKESDASRIEGLTNHFVESDEEEEYPVRSSKAAVGKEMSGSF